MAGEAHLIRPLSVAWMSEATSGFYLCDDYPAYRCAHAGYVLC
jgi:hypothetical protein